MVKNLPTSAGDKMKEDPLEKEMATHLSILAWEIPQPKEPGRLQFHAVTRVTSKLLFSKAFHSSPNLQPRFQF